MKTLRTMEIDGYKIITGLDSRVIDPEATRIAAMEACMTAPEKSAVDAAVGVYRSVPPPKRVAPPGRGFDEADWERWSSERDAARRMMEATQTAYNGVLRQYARSNPVFFDLREGEVETADDYAIPEVPPGSVVTTSGAILPDLRGTMWLTEEGVPHVISRLGEDPPEGTQRFESADEGRKLRHAIRALPPELVTALHESLLRSAEAEAVSRRSTDEVKGVESGKALADAREYVQRRREELALIFGTEDPATPPRS